MKIVRGSGCGDFLVETIAGPKIVDPNEPTVPPPERPYPPIPLPPTPPLPPHPPLPDPGQPPTPIAAAMFSGVGGD